MSPHRPAKSSRKPGPPVLGLTGGVGCGKTIIADELESLDAVIISGDKVGHDVVADEAQVQKALVDAFGSGIRTKQGISRKKLARRAFATPEGRQQLNAIVHPALIRELNRRVRREKARRKAPLIVVDAALLVEWNGKVPVDFLVAVWASGENRRRWLRKRGWSDEEITDRMRAQLPFAARRRVADRVIRNDGDLDTLRRKAHRLWQNLTNAS